MRCKLGAVILPSISTQALDLNPFPVPKQRNPLEHLPSYIINTLFFAYLLCCCLACGRPKGALCRSSRQNLHHNRRRKHLKYLCCFGASRCGIDQSRNTEGADLQFVVHTSFPSLSFLQKIKTGTFSTSFSFLKFVSCLSTSIHINLFLFKINVIHSMSFCISHLFLKIIISPLHMTSICIRFNLCRKACALHLKISSGRHGLSAASTCTVNFTSSDLLEQYSNLFDSSSAETCSLMPPPRNAIGGHTSQDGNISKQ